MQQLSVAITKRSRNPGLENVINHQMAGTKTFVHLVDPEALEVCNDLFTSGVNQIQASFSTYCQPPHASRFLLPFLTAGICRGPITRLSSSSLVSLHPPHQASIKTPFWCYS